MSLVNYAKDELGRIMNGCKDEDSKAMQKMMNDGIIKVVEAFSEGEHSGFSAGYAISAITRLLKFKPLTKLTGEDDEWNECGTGVYQNKRCSAVFKDGKDNSTAHYIEGKICSDNGGITWFTRRTISSVPVKFPFAVPDKPEKVYLDETGEFEIFGDDIALLYEKKKAEFDSIEFK